MDERAFLVDIAKRLLAYDKAGTTALEDAPYRNPASTYNDPDLFEIEKDKVFRRTPQLACFSSDLPGTGSFRTFDDLGVPILLTRDHNGEVHALLNACAHRGMRLKDGSGSARLLTCIYHAWSYELNGKLKTVNAQSTFGEFDTSCYNLIEFPCQEKYGLIFVAADPSVEIDIEHYLGDVVPIFEHWRLDTLKPVKSGEFRKRTNWKLAMDTFFEGYHFASLHKDSVGDYALSNISEYYRFGPEQQHHRLAFPNTWFREYHEQPESKWGDAEKVFGAFQLVHYIFPNITLLISPRACEFFQIYPGATVGEHVTRYTCYWRGHQPLDTPEQKREAEEHFDFIYKVVDEEDYWAGECVYKSLQSGLVPYTTFGRNEPALINAHKAFRRVAGVPEQEPPLCRQGGQS